MKRTLLCLLALHCSATSAFAATEVVDGIAWTYYSWDGEAEIGGSWNSTAIPTSTEGAITIPTRLGGCLVTTIGNWAFRGCSRLTAIAIPDSVKSIESMAFMDCSDDLFDTNSIPGVKLVDGWAVKHLDSLSGNLDLAGIRGIADYSFHNAAGLTSVLVPDGVTSIGSGAFYGCSGLTSISIPGSVTNIESDAFCDCFGLTSIAIPSNVKSIGNDAFAGCSGLSAVHISDLAAWCSISYEFTSGDTIPRAANPCTYAHHLYLNGEEIKGLVVPDGMTAISPLAFSGCSELTSVTIPDGVTTIGKYAFSGCSGLSSIAIPSGTTSIGEHAFSGCSGLSSVTMQTGANIGEYAFSGCSGLTSFSFPSSIGRIGSSAFSGCSSLSEVYLPIPSYKTRIEAAAFPETTVVYLTGTNSFIPKQAFEYSPGLTSVVIPDGVTSIGDDAFHGCSGLSSITIPDSVTRINECAFSNCSEDLFDTNSVPGVKLVDGWAIEHLDSLSGNLNLTGVRGIAPGAFEYCTGLSAVVMPNGLTSIAEEVFLGCSGLEAVSIPDGVTSIGRHAFSGCSGLMAITIPVAVTNIGQQAFSDCSGLEQITADPKWGGLFSDSTVDCAGSTNFSFTIPIGVTTIGENSFWACGRMTSITIPNTVTNIEDHAFYYCDGLTSVSIPESVTSIGAYAFQYCSGLTSITIPDGVGNIGEATFEGCSGLASVTIPDSVTSIGDRAFQNCSGLASVAIPDNVTSIGYEAFRGCSSLTSVTIPDSVTSIGEQAFEGCSGLTSITIPDSVTNIGDFAFDGCSGLSSVTIGNGVTSIGQQTFKGCSGLTSITIPGSVTIIGSSAFSGCSGLTSVTISNGVTSIEGGAFSGCSGLEAVSIPDGVTSIGRHAFSGCSGLTSITIPDGVTSIGPYAFSNCSRLTSVTIPDSVTRVGDYDFANTCFQGCSDIKDVVVPGRFKLETLFPSSYRSITNVVVAAGSTSISYNAFRNCTELTSITIPESVTDVGWNAFSGCSGLTSITIPESLGEQTDEWNLPEKCQVVIDGSFDVGIGNVRVAKTWISEHAPVALAAAGGRHSSAALTMAANGINKVWECYLAGLEPTNTAERFEAQLVFQDGVPLVTWSPNLGDVRDYLVEGKASLADDWGEVGENSRFFRVRVAMPGTFPPPGGISANTGSWTTGVWTDGTGASTDFAAIAEESNLARLAGTSFASTSETSSEDGYVLNDSAVLFDGAVGGGTVRDKGSRFAIDSLSVLTWTFPDVCRVDGVRIYNIWNDSGRDQIAISSVLVKLSGDDETWHPVCASSVSCEDPAADASSPGRPFAFLAMPDGSPLAAGATALQIWWDWAESDWVGCAEIEIVGTVTSLSPWISRRFSIVFDTDGGSAVAPISATAGATVTAPENPTKDGYDFAGWSPAFPATMPIGGASLVAQWTPRQYTITFDTDGGDEIAPITAACGEAVTAPTDPAKDGYDFVGWSPSFPATMPAGGATLVAQWRRSTAALAAALDSELPFTMGGAAEWFPENYETHDGVSAAQSGAIPDSRSTWIETIVTGSGTLSFWWSVSSEDWCDYLQFFIDGVEQANISGYRGWSQMTFEIPDNEEHTLRWTYSKDSGTSVGSDCGWLDEVVWTPDVYTLRFDANGGTGEMDDMEEIAGGTAVTLPMCEFSRPGWTFVGWARSADGPVEWSDGETAATGFNDLVSGGVAMLFARWSRGTYTVRFDANGGTGTMPDATFRTDIPQTLPQNAFAKDGMSFGGWTTNGVDSVVWSDGASVENLVQPGGTATLKAIWIEKRGLDVRYYDISSSEALSYTERAMASYFAERTPTIETNSLAFGETLDPGISNVDNLDYSEFVDFGYTGLRFSSYEETTRFHGVYGSMNRNNFCVFATGTINVETSGTYRFGAVADDRFVLFIDGVRVLYVNWTDVAGGNPASGTGSIDLSAGLHTLSIGFYEGSGGEGFFVQWKRPGDSTWSPLPQSILGGSN